MAKKKKSLKDFKVTDGKNRDEMVQKARQLEDLLGIKDMNPYKTLNEQVFEDNLSSMSIAQMTELAQRVGISGMEMSSKNTLKNSLRDSFKIYLRQHNVSVAGPPTPVISTQDPEIKKLFEL
jgi:hypothetical protein